MSTINKFKNIGEEEIWDAENIYHLNTKISRISKLINHYGKLDNLIIINSNTLVEQMLKMIKLILNKEYHKCIKIIHNKKEYNTKLDDLKLNENVDNTIIKSFHN